MPRIRTRFLLTSRICIFLLAAIPNLASAQITNGSFETSVTGWTISGRVESLLATNFTPNIAVPAGTRMALLSTTPNPGGSLTIDIDGNGTLEGDIATMSQTFTIAAATTLSFTWCFATSEQEQPAAFDDIFEVDLSGSPILRRSVYKPGGLSPWSDTQTLVAANYRVTSTGLTNGSVFDDGRTGFTAECVTIPAAGTYTLMFRIADQGDTAYDSGLIVDNVQLGACTPTIGQMTSTSGSNVTLKSGGFVFTQAFNGPSSSSAFGPVNAFVSNANLTGDNPSLQTQVFAYANGVFERLTTMTDRQAGRPSLTSTGRFVAFASNANLTGGNADSNYEIFRYDRTLKQTTQITATTGGCSNQNPSIAGDNAGNHIAFQSNCTTVGAFSNPDGNDEIVYWNGTAFSGANRVSPCRSIEPSINRGSGQYVAFASNCNITPVSPTGSNNSDLNWEIYRWDTTANTYRQITNSTTNSGAVVLNASPSISTAGDYIAFVGSGAYSGNADGNMEAWRWLSTATFLALTTTASPLQVHVAAVLGDDPRYVAVERYDVLSDISEILQIDTISATTINNPIIVASGGNLPSLGYVGNTPIVAFQANKDFTTGNTDLNQELFTSTTAVGTGRSYCQTEDPVLAIPNNNTTGVNSTQSVADTGTINDINVYVEITHPYVGDIIVTLAHGATTVTLIDRPGYTGSGNGCTRANIQTTLDDEATTGVETQCATTTPTIYGTFVPGTGTPATPLTAFDGQALNGNWVLNVSDRGNNNKTAGSLVRWCLYARTN